MTLTTLIQRASHDTRSAYWIPFGDHPLQRILAWSIHDTENGAWNIHDTENGITLERYR